MKIRKICKKDFSEICAPNKTSSYTWAIPSLLYPILSWKTLAFWPGLAIRRLANGSHRHLGLYPDVSTRAAQIHWFWSSDTLSTGRLQTFGVLKGAKCCLLHHIVVVAFLGGGILKPNSLRVFWFTAALWISSCRKLLEPFRRNHLLSC